MREKRTSRGGTVDGGPADAAQRAMRLLVRREHSDRELRRKLAERGVTEADAAAALETLKARNWQSDARFGESLVRRRLEAGYGPRVIEAELASHGIDRGEASALLKGENWDERARAALARRASGEAADAAARRKLATWLERRGFPAGAIRFALGTLERVEVDDQT